MDVLDDIFNELETEMAKAQSDYGSYTSTHEALGVIAEEYHELVEAIRKNKPDWIIREAIQLSAAAARLAVNCEDSDSHFNVRSGFEKGL